MKTFNYWIMVTGIVLFAAPVLSTPPALGAQSRSADEMLRDVVPNLSAAERAELIENEYIQYYNEDTGIEFRFMPDSSVSNRVRTAFADHDPSVVNEVLYLLPKPEVEGDVLLFLYNKLRAVSRLSGVTYISGRTGEEKVLFDDVYRIDSVRNANKQPDPIVRRIPNEDSFLIHLIDSNFGRSFFRATYIGGDDAVAMSMTNAARMTYIIPVIGTENLRFQLVAMPIDDYLLFYAVVGVEVGGFFRRVVDIPASFRRRIEALGQWFIEEVYDDRQARASAQAAGA